MERTQSKKGLKDDRDCIVTEENIVFRPGLIRLYSGIMVALKNIFKQRLGAVMG